MPRQAVLAALVVYRKSTLPPPLACLPCLTAKKSQHGGAVPFAVLPRQAALAALVVKSIAGRGAFCLMVYPVLHGKAPVFLKTGALPKGVRFSAPWPDVSIKGRRREKIALMSAR